MRILKLRVLLQLQRDAHAKLIIKIALSLTNCLYSNWFFYNMKIKNNNILRIVFNALDFEERNAYKEYFLERGIFFDSTNEKIFWKEWQEITGDTNNDNLDKRKRWEGRANNLKYPKGKKYIEGYINFLKKIDKLSNTNTVKIQEHECFHKDNELPFEEILLPLVQSARRLLKNKLKDKSAQNLPHLNFITNKAYLSLESALLENITKIFKWVLLEEFTQFRPNGFGFLNALSYSGVSSNNINYNNFVKKYHNNGFYELFEKYPVLSRQLYDSISFWLNNIYNLIKRFERDSIKIIKTFITTNPEQDVNIVEFSNSLSDSHENGKTVVCITFNTGDKIIYKPRSLDIDVTYFETLNWINIHNSESIIPQFKILRIIPKKEYGWVEFIQQLPCKNEDEIKNFYFRAGMHLSLFYLFKGTDLHYENIIANGEFPVIVDLETLFYPDSKPLKNSPAEIALASSINTEYSDSVLRSGLLPHWTIRNDSNMVIDTSGLGAIPNQKLSIKTAYIKNVNKDDMHLNFKESLLTSNKNNVFFENRIITAEKYVSNIIEGFEHLYLLILKNKKQFLSNHSPFYNFKNCQIRYIYRNTAIYNAFLYNLSLPQSLTDGDKYRLEIEKLGRIFNTVKIKPKEFEVFRSEISALKKMDYPRYITITGSKSLYFENKCIVSKYFSKSIFNVVLSRINKISKKDLGKQKDLITGSFYARYEGACKSFHNKTIKISNLKDSNFNNKDYLLFASEIASFIIDNSYKKTPKSINWLGMSFSSHVGKYHYRPLSYNLYDGVCGIGVFYASFYKVTGNELYKNICLKAIAELRYIIHTHKPRDLNVFTIENGIGGGSGIGSMIYSFVHISKMLDDLSLIEDAYKLADLITPEIIQKDIHYDIIGGSAGLVLSLISLYKYKESKIILDKITLACNHLIKNRIPTIYANIKVWKGLWNKPLTGFSHGASGISYALVKSYEINKNTDYLTVAKDGLLYERKLFSKKHSNWPDFTGQIGEMNEEKYSNTWCHGAPGITLARIGMLSTIDDNELLSEIRIGLKTAMTQELRSLDHLCCGNWGLIEIWLNYNEKVKDNSYSIQMAEILNKTIQRKLNEGQYQLYLDMPLGNSNPGFFRGLSGIGYQYLRLAYPNILPSILLWE